MPSEATHKTLDLFEKQPLLFTFDKAFTQRLVTHQIVQCFGLKFWVEKTISSIRKNFLKLNTASPEQ